MGLFFQNATVANLLCLLLFIGISVFINEISRRSLKVSILVFCIVPVLLLTLVFIGVFGSPVGKTWFGWVKLFSALLGVYGFLLIRFTKLGKTKFSSIFPVSILSLNIAEAVYREFQVFLHFKTVVIEPSGAVILGGYWNILNCIAGIITIITLTGFVGIRASKDKYKDMVWPDMTRLYLWGYTLWNFTYVYNCISTRAMYAGFAILIAALISEYVFKKGVWLQHRAQTLVVYVMFALSFDYQSSKLFQIVPVYKRSMWGTMSILSLILNLFLLGYTVYTIVKMRKNPVKEEIFTNTKYYKECLLANNLDKEP